MIICFGICTQLSPSHPCLELSCRGREREREMYFLPVGKLTKGAYYTQIIVGQTIWEMSYGAEPSYPSDYVSNGAPTYHNEAILCVQEVLLNFI